MPPTTELVANGHCLLSFDRAMKFDYHHCIAELAAGVRGSGPGILAL